MKIITDTDVKSLKSQAGKALSELIVSAEERPILLLLAGGSSLDIVRFIDSEILSGRITIAMSDERFSTDPAINNFCQFTTTEFYAVAKKRGAHFIDSRVDAGEELEAFGKRIELSLKDWVAENPSGSIFALFGIGADGHTAGIMPFPEDPQKFTSLFESESWYTAYDASGKNEHNLRATITMTFILRMLNARVIYATGKNKQAALERMLEEKGTLTETPARIHAEDPNAILFTDLALKA